MKKINKVFSYCLLILMLINNVDFNVMAFEKYGKYEKIKVEDLKVSDDNLYSYSEDEYIENYDSKQELIDKMEAMKEYTLLKPKTDEKYEIALAYSDGSYEYVDNAETIDKAIEMAKSIKNEDNDLSIIPTVINEIGQVVYATKSMGRVWKHINGDPYNDISLTSNVYSSDTASDPFIVINQNSIDDVPIIEDNGKRAKIQVNGYKGWIDRDPSSSEYDLVVVPINQVTNPSCYLVQDGYLYHYISYNMTDINDANGYSLRIGKAPDFMEAGKEYYSYDGVYFYAGENRLDGLNKLAIDLSSNITLNSINYNNPYYNYYQYLPFRTKTSYTAEEIDNFIINNPNVKENSKLIGLGETLVECQEKYGVNPLLILGIAINESGWGGSPIAQTKNNLFGLNAIDISPGQSADTFKTPEDCVREFAYYWISKGYADPQDWRYNGGLLGNKAIGTNVKYASDPYWGEKAAQHAFSIDLYLSGNEIDKLKDYNGYKLVAFNKESSVLNKDNNLLYNISKEIECEDDYYIFNISALKFEDINDNNKYQVFADRTTNISEGEYEGNYNWNDNGFIDGVNLQFINSTSKPFIPGYSIEDVNKDGEVDINDLANVSLQYNKLNTESDFKNILDLNCDNIIDIFDLIMISKKI